jgi:hypothetical protein
MVQVVFEGDIKRLTLSKKPGQDGVSVRAVVILLEAPVSSAKELTDLSEGPVKVTVQQMQGKLRV